MASVNKCTFIGNVTRDPEVRYLQSGEAVANLSIACNETWKGKDGEKQESVEFVNLVFFKRLAEIVGEYVKKGASIYVEGKMKTEKYTDKIGVEKYATKIIVNEMKMLGGKREESSEPRPSNAEPARKPSAQPAAKSNFDNFDDDIPFMRHGHRGAGVCWRAM